MINIAFLYYDLMNLYGESGNIKALTKELDNQGIKYNIDYLTISDKLEFSKYNLKQSEPYSLTTSIGSG